MNRCIVIYGDRQIGNAIADGIQRSVVKLDRGELAAVKAECKKLKAVNGVRALADEKRWNKTRKKLARKYSTKPVGRVRGAILVIWARAWLALVSFSEYVTREV